MEVAEYIALTPEIIQLITAEQAWHYHIVPKQSDDTQITFYTDKNHFNSGNENELELLFGKRVVCEPTDKVVIRATLGRYYRKQRNTNGQPVEINSSEAEDFLVQLIHEAKSLGSSDIHIEVYDDKARVRIRIDGMLIEKYNLKKTDYPALINKIKIRANLDISEKRLPQDGRIRLGQGKDKLDMRVSVLPTLHGEKVVLRLLSNDATNIELSALGLSKSEEESYLEGIRQPNGIILISGPTGSGKTTTLYATLKILNEEKRNILTVEDPIEYTLDGINQVQLKESIGLTFASALRTFLRQDPDVIMLGEIRDGETAQMAIRVALTGHLVLSTIHTNSAWGTVSRLIDMGVPSFLIANTLNTTVAQRLIRLLCPSCKTERPFDTQLYPRQFRPPVEIGREAIPVGCEECFYTGYKGRTAIYEIIPIDTYLADKIRNNQLDIRDTLKEKKIPGLSQNAFQLFANGETSLEEIYPLLLNPN